ncbi:hypothetical protein SKAU_G00379710 [Synaphobranchus kaupii]|uniref:Uncharacterized protein n=1 Tax=Synaphobranchus kaupii TaxID=118154 RepID=A0A9Q1IEK3_SYNKA|nr:hypothetical protein SKAU_G00379710 [Synaphobranchus kaupii]
MIPQRLTNIPVASLLSQAQSLLDTNGVLICLFQVRSQPQTDNRQGAPRYFKLAVRAEAISHLFVRYTSEDVTL